MKNKITAIFLSAVMAAASAASVFADAGDARIYNEGIIYKDGVMYKTGVMYNEDFQGIIRVDNTVIEFGDTVPIIANGYVYVPIRPVFEQMGTVDWDAETKTVIITDENTKLELYTPTGEIHVNGVEIKLPADEPALPIVENGTTMLPLKRIAEALNAAMTWIDSTIDIYSYGYQLEKLEEMTSGVPLPKAIYMTINNDSGVSFGSIDSEILLDFADNEGYEELVSAMLDMKAVSEETDALGYDYTDDEYDALGEKYMEALCRFSYCLMVGLEGLEDKSNLTGLIGTMLQNTYVTVDNSVSDKDSLAAIEELYEADGNISVTVNQKLAPLARTYAADDGMLNYSVDEYSLEQDLFTMLILSEYKIYLSDYDPEISAAADMYGNIFGTEEDRDF